MTKNRDDKGRFIAGNTCGPGRPKRVTERRYLEIMVNAVDETKWEIICKQAAHDAMQGDWSARKFLAEYLMGVPAKTLNLNVGDMAVLTQLIKAIEARGMEASTLFAAMLNEIAIDADYIDITENEENYE